MADDNHPDELADDEEFSASDNGLAIAGFVLAFVFPPLGLILSIVGLNKAGEVGGEGRGLAIAGIVIGGLFSLWTAFWVVSFGLFWQGGLPLPEEETRRTFALKQFNADQSEWGVLIASGDIRRISADDGRLRYQPATPDTCRYRLGSYSRLRAHIDDFDWTTYSDPLTIGPTVGISEFDIDTSSYLAERYHVTADGCGDWQLINNPPFLSS